MPLSEACQRLLGASEDKVLEQRSPRTPALEDHCRRRPYAYEAMYLQISGAWLMLSQTLTYVVPPLTQLVT